MHHSNGDRERTSVQNAHTSACAAHTASSVLDERVAALQTAAAKDRAAYDERVAALRAAAAKDRAEHDERVATMKAVASSLRCRNKAEMCDDARTAMLEQNELCARVATLTEKCDLLQDDAHIVAAQWQNILSDRDETIVTLTQKCDKLEHAANDGQKEMRDLQDLQQRTLGKEAASRHLKKLAEENETRALNRATAAEKRCVALDNGKRRFD